MIYSVCYFYFIYYNQIYQMSNIPQNLNPNNFTKLSKIIESNKIEVSTLEETVKREIQKNRQTYAFPASIAKAKLHSYASKFGFRRDLKGQIPVVCACCSLRMDNEPLPICYSTSESTLEFQHNYQQFKLPPGIALFFSLLKATIFYIFLLAVFTGYYLYSSAICQITDIVPSLSLFDCLGNSTSTDTSIDTSTVPTANQLTVNILFLASLVVAIICFIIYRKQKNAWHKLISSRNLGEDTFTIMISNIPVLDFPKPGESKQNKSEFFYRKHLETYLQERIKQWVETSDKWQSNTDSNEKDYLDVLNKNEGHLKSQEIVKSISLCYNLNRLEIIDETRNMLTQQHEKQQESNNQLIEQDKNEDRFSTIPKKLDFINDCRVVLNNQFASDNSFLFNLTHFVGHAFVSFQYQHYRNFFLDSYQKNSNSFIYNGNVLKIIPASHPDDIHWKNLRVPNQQKQRLQLNTYFIILLIFCLEFLVLLGLNQLLYNIHSLIDTIQLDNIPIIFILVASIIIVIVNSILKKVLSHSVHHQKHKNRVNETTTYINKSVFAQSLNSTVTFLLLNILNSKNNLHLMVNYFMIISCSLQILYQLVQPVWIGRGIRRWWRYRKLDNQGTVNLFQIKLNREFQYPTFEIAKRYSYYLYKIFVAVFFAYPAPLGLVITFITLALMYWLDKFNLFKRSSLYYNGNISISNHALKVLQFSLLVYAVGVFYFSSNSQNQINFPALAGVIFAFVYVFFIILAPLKLERLIFGRDIASNKFIYDDCVSQGNFSQTYWNQNPATSLIEQRSVTGKQMVTNPSLMRRFANEKDYQNIL